MNIFDLLINLFESFLFTYFIGAYFKVSNKIKYIFIFTFLQLLLLNYAQHINDNGLWLSISIISLMVISLYIWNKKISFDYIYIVLVYNMSIILSAYIGLFIANISMNLLNLSSSSIQHIILCTTAKITQAIITFYTIKKNINLSTSLDLKNWNSIILTDSLTLIAMALITYSMITNRYTPAIARAILFTLFFLAICYRQTIIKIDILNKEKIKFIKNEELNKYNQQKLAMMNHLKNDITSTDHRMFYMLCQIEQYAKNKKYDSLEKALEKYRELMSKYKMVTTSGNAIFDCLFSLKINDFILRGISVETSIFITQKDLYNDMMFLNQITGLIDLFGNCQSILISMNEIGELLALKIIYRDGLIAEQNLKEYCNLHFSDYATYNIENHALKGIRISINMSEKYGKLYN